MGVRERLPDDVRPFFRDFGESVTLRPRAGSEESTFLAVIQRAEPDNRGEAGGFAAATLRVLIRKTADTTAGAPEIVEGDVIALDLRPGDTVQTDTRVLAVASVNRGFWRVEVAP